MALSIGELARHADVKIPTIRYYEQIGLMPETLRTEGKQRRYGKPAIARLAFIRHARELGFEIDAIRTLLSLQDHPEQSCSQADQIAKVRLVEVDKRIASLKALRKELLKMVEECAQGRVGDCRVIETLADRSHSHKDWKEALG